jgi:uncharacterized protein YjbI with pentapeptide repeats
VDHVIEDRHAFLALARGAGQARLVSCDIRRCDLNDLTLESPHFVGSRLNQVGMVRTRLRGAIIERTTLQASALRGADLRDASLLDVGILNCELIETDFSGSRWRRTELFETTFMNAVVDGAHLLDTHFSDCPLSYGRFVGATLMRVRFSGGGPGQPEMTRTDFSRALLTDVNLAGANLYGASFADACLVRVNLRGCNLVDADFRGAVLVETDFSGADLDRAKWDEGGNA